MRSYNDISGSEGPKLYLELSVREVEALRKELKFYWGTPPEIQDIDEHTRSFLRAAYATRKLDRIRKSEIDTDKFSTDPGSSFNVL